MEKGFEWPVLLIGAIILVVISAGIFWAALAGKTPPIASAEPDETVSMDKSCKNDNDCTSNLDGTKCMVIYPGDFTSFCGCITSAECVDRRSGACGSNNKCI